MKSKVNTGFIHRVVLFMTFAWEVHSQGAVISYLLFNMAFSPETEKKIKHYKTIFSNHPQHHNSSSSLTNCFPIAHLQFRWDQRRYIQRNTKKTTKHFKINNILKPSNYQQFGNESRKYQTEKKRFLLFALTLFSKWITEVHIYKYLL
jgi:hypothetical protein